MEDLTMPASTYIFIWLGWVAILIYALYERFRYKEAAKIAVEKVIRLETGFVAREPALMSMYRIYSIYDRGFILKLDSSGDAIISADPQDCLKFSTIADAKNWLTLSGLDTYDLFICSYARTL